MKRTLQERMDSITSLPWSIFVLLTFLSLSVLSPVGVSEAKWNDGLKKVRSKWKDWRANWSESVMNPSCHMLRNDFSKLMEELEAIKISDRQNNDFSLRDMREKYQQLMALKLAYKGILELKSNYLQNMMSYHSGLTGEEKLDTLNSAVMAVGDLKAFHGLLEGIDYKEVGTGAAKTFHLGHFMKDNPDMDGDNFKLHIETICQGNSTNKLCQQINDAAKKDNAENLLDGFFQISQLGHFDDSTLEHFQEQLEDLELDRPKNQDMETLTRLQDSVLELQKCQEGHPLGQCEDHQTIVTKLEGNLEALQGKLKDSFERNEVQNFSATMKNLFTANKLNMQTESFYRRIEKLQIGQYHKRIREINTEIRAKLEKICGRARFVDMVNVRCKQVNLHDKHLLAELRQMKERRSVQEEKIKNGKYYPAWEKRWQETAPARKKFDGWIKGQFTTPETMMGWNFFLHKEDPNCAQAFLDPNRGSDFAECLKSIPAGAQDGVNAAFAKYKNAWNAKGADGEDFRDMVTGINSAVRDVALDYFNIVRKQLRNLNDGKKGPDVIKLCDQIDQIKDKGLTKDNLSLNDTIDCLESLDGSLLTAQEKKVDEDIQEALMQIQYLQQQGPIKAKLNQISYTIQGMAQEKCDADTKTAMNQMNEAFVFECNGETTPTLALAQFTNQVEKVVDNIQQGKLHVPQEKWIVGMSDPATGHGPDTFERYKEMKGTEKALDSVIGPDSKFSSGHAAMGVAMAIPSMITPWMEYSTTSMMNTSLYNWGTYNVWNMHYAYMYGYGGFGFPYF